MLVQRRGLRVELAVVLGVTFGISAVTATLQLADAVLRNLSVQRIPLNPRRSYFDLIDLGLNVALAAQLIAWGGLGVYLLWRSGLSPARIGLGRPHWRTDLLGGVEDRARHPGVVAPDAEERGARRRDEDARHADAEQDLGRKHV